MAETQTEKLHAACDECRTRKLKCSGESPQCSRCEREGIRCVYSPQKQMGRPRKRRREEPDSVVAELPNESSHESNASRIGNIDTPSFSDFGIISSNDLTEFSGFTEFQGGESIATSIGPHQHADSILTNGYTQGPTPNLDYCLGPAIDPSLWNAEPTASKIDPSITYGQHQPDDAPCTCLSIMYLSLTELQTLSSFAFPQVMPPLRHAMSTVSTIIHCEKCPNGTFSSIQNVQSLSALLSAIAERFHQILFEVDREAERLERSGEKKTFRIGDSDPALQHLHTGTEDCPMGYNIELDAKEWKSLVKKAIRTEVIGGGSNPTPFSALLDQFEERQYRWHTGDNHLEERARIFGQNNMCRPGDAHCVRMINHVRAMIRNMQF